MAEAKNINSCMDKTYSKECEKINKLLARAIYTSAVPLDLLENEHWQAFLKQLQPSLQLPSIHILSTKLLDEEYNQIQHQVKSRIQSADALTLMSGGWTDINDTSVNNLMFTTPEPVYYMTIESKMNTRTDDFVYSVLSKAIDEVGSHKVKAVVTDNAASMHLAWDLLKEKYPHLITYGCITDGLQLLIRDILTLPTIKDVLNKSRDIIKHFTCKERPRMWLKQIQVENVGRATVLIKPTKTRRSYVASLQSLLNNKECIQMVAATVEFRNQVKPHLLHIILEDKSFWQGIKNVLNLLQCPFDTISKIESDAPSSLSYMFSNMEIIYCGILTNYEFLPRSEKENLLESFNNRRRFMYHVAQLAAHLLNPKIKDIFLLSEEQEKMAKTFIIDYSLSIGLDRNKILKDLGEYCSKRALWDDPNIWDAAGQTDPITWWKGYCSQRELHKVAVILISFPAVAAACEGSWSRDVDANIAAKKGNYLTVDQTKKLLYVNYNLELFKRIERSRNASYSNSTGKEIEGKMFEMINCGDYEEPNLTIKNEDDESNMDSDEFDEETGDA